MCQGQKEWERMKRFQVPLSTEHRLSAEQLFAPRKREEGQISGMTNESTIHDRECDFKVQGLKVKDAA